MTTTIRQTLEEAYFEWLSNQAKPEAGQQTYEELLWYLFTKEFVFLIPNDDNRVADGLDLLIEWFREFDLEMENVRVDGRGCNYLEMIVGLSRRCAFVAGGDPISWAWHLIGNLGFHSLSDPLTPRNRRYVDEVCDRVTFRLYQPDGRGGIFPLSYTEEDQRKVELWYQMQAYIEQNPVE